MKEVLARINVQFLHADHMRAGAEKQSFTAGPLTINFQQRRVTVKGNEPKVGYRFQADE